MSECNTLNVLIVEKAKTKKSLCFGAARALFSRAFARDNEEERKKERKAKRARSFFFRWFFLGNARACVLQRCLPRSEKISATSPRGCPREEVTTSIDTKFGVNKKGAEACEKRERERERAKARKAKATYLGSFSFDVPFLSMSSSHEREERRRSNLSSRGTYLIA